jgi:DNA-directed RNA polymerase specialized sigma24 family protein
MADTDEELFLSLYAGLRRFAAVVGASDDDPDDLVQDALVRALRGGGLSRLDSPDAYLRRTIVNLAADRRRSWSRRRRAWSRLGVQGPGGAEFPSDLADLEQLAPLDRAVLYLTDVDGHSLVDVANHLGLTHDAARLRASRARRRLRLVIENEEQ